MPAVTLARWLVMSLLIMACGLFSARLIAADPIRVLIIDGQNNHDWETTTPYLRHILEETGRFSVTIATTPPRGANDPAAWDAFRPDFSKADVVLSNYNGETWPLPVREAFEKFMAGGGGMVNVHAANNPFPDWPEFNRMIGMAWRGAGFGDRIALDDDGNEVRFPAGEGAGAGHGPQYPYSVVVRDREHPVLHGFPAEWMHPRDELYHGQRGPALNMHILATAYASRDKGGTGYHEPMVWWIPYGQGRVFTTVLGHHGRGQPLADSPMRDRAFHALVTRGCEWAATGNVTIPLPAMMPTAEEASLAPVPSP